MKKIIRILLLLRLWKEHVLGCIKVEKVEFLNIRKDLKTSAPQNNFLYQWDEVLYCQIQNILQ